jgi:hypothetical protein
LRYAVVVVFPACVSVCESSPPSSCWPYTDEIYFKKSFFFFFFFFILSLLPLTSNNRDKTVNLNELKQDNKRREKKRKREANQKFTGGERRAEEIGRPATA